MTHPILNAPLRFSAQVIDKVERLLDVLSALRDASVFHGGTALHFLDVDASRLSVDFDLLFGTGPDVDTMCGGQPEVAARFRRVVQGRDCLVQGMSNEHGRQTSQVKCPGDCVKTDISCLAQEGHE